MISYNIICNKNILCNIVNFTEFFPFNSFFLCNYCTSSLQEFTLKPLSVSFKMEMIFRTSISHSLIF